VCGNVFTEPLSNNNRGCTYTHAVEMGSGAMIYIPSFIKIGSGVQKLIWVDTQTHTDTDNMVIA
jgi:hypothetical protein